MSASAAARAASTGANKQHAIASIVGLGVGLIFVTAQDKPQFEAAAEFQRPEGGRESARQAAASSSSGTKDELQLVQVVFRHGARTPLGQRYWPALNPQWDVCGQAFDAVPVEVLTEDGGPRPVNPDDEKQVHQRYAGGCSKGELTLVGQEQAREFGRWLRWRYSMVHTLLPDTHQPGVVVARTTNYSRTVATLQGVLSGLFPGTKQPIRVHTTEEIDEILYTNVKSCKRLHNLMLGLHKELKERQQQEPAETGALEQQVRAALNLPPEEKVHWVDLHDAMTTMLTHKKEVPAGMRDERLLRGINRHATDRFMHLVAPHPDTGKQQEVLRLGMGVLMGVMVRRMEEAAGGRGGDTKMFLYSGHDTSIMPLLAALGKQVTDWPPYLSNLTMELWRRPEGEQYVKVLYNQKELPLTELCGDAACELHQFRDKVLGPFLLTRDQHQKECLLHFLHDQPAGEHTETEDVQVGSSFEEEDEEEAQGGGQKAAAAEAAAEAAGAAAVPATAEGAAVPAGAAEGAAGGADKAGGAAAAGK